MNSTTRARQLRSNLTDAERAIWNILRNRQFLGLRFRRQAPIGPYIVDFVSYEIKLIIEVDGGQRIEKEDYDATRTGWLKSQGFEVIRFWNNQALGDMEAVQEAILLAVNRLKRSL